MLDLLKPVFRKILIDADFFFSICVSCILFIFFLVLLYFADSFVFIVESIFYLCLTTKIGFTRIKLNSATCK